MRGRVRLVGVALTLVLSACAWTQAGGNAGRTGDAPMERTFTPANAAQAVLKWSADSNAPSGDVAVGNGLVYATNVNGLQAWDITHPTCSGSPQHCWPTWTASYGFSPSTPVILDHDVLFASATPTTWRLYAIDPAGKQNCTTGPSPTCRPLWIGEFARHTGPTEPPQLTAAAGRVYVQTTDPDTRASRITAFVVSQCEGAGGQICAPAFVTADAGPGAEQLPAFADGRLFVSGTDGIRVYDGAGVAGCAANTCTPLYTLTGSGPHGAAVTGGEVFTTAGRQLLVFDANGTQRCSGSPRRCQPLWTADLGVDAAGDAPMVTADRVFVRESGYDAVAQENRGAIEGFDRSGQASCTGAPAVCSPVYVAVVSAYADASVAGDLLLVSETGQFLPPSDNPMTLRLFDAGGTTNCSGTPTRCTSLADVPVGHGPSSALRPAAANGVIVVPSQYESGFFVVGLP